MNNSSTIRIGLTKYYSNLIDTAKRELKWFYGKSHGLEFWFSPKEFESRLSEGGEWISKINWILKSPRERVQELKFFIEEMKSEIEDISKVYYQENSNL